MADAIVATERIHERIPVPRSKRTRKVLRYGPGQVVPPADVDRLNVKADGTQSSVPTAEDGSTVSVPLPAKKAAAKRKAPAKAAAKKASPAKKAAKKAPAKKR